MPSKISTFIAELIPDYIEELKSSVAQHARALGFSAGITKGEADGKKAGHAEGYAKGFADGKQVWEIVNNNPIAVPKPLDTSIYGPKRFDVTEAMETHMRAAVADAVSKGIVDAPTDDQWKMIFASSPATCVIAGAGSGKSTTLVLRAVFMLIYLKIPRREITIVSFTNNACEELRRSLAKVMLHWNPVELIESELRQLIRTFHSALFRVSRSVFGRVDFFENVNEENIRGSLRAEDDDDGADVENPFSSPSKLNNAQLDILNDAYRTAYTENADFRRHVLAVLKIEMERNARATLKNEKDPNGYKLNRIAERDRNLINAVNKRYKELGKWPDCVTEEGPIEVFRKGGRPFFANALVGTKRTPLFLSAFKLNDGQVFFPDGFTIHDDDGENEFSIFGCLGTKRDVTARFFPNTHIYVKNGTDLDNLNLWVSFLGDEFSDGRIVPPVEVQLDGEIKASSIAAAFYAQGSFIENMGMRVDAAITKMPAFSAPLERHFCAALAIYWRYFSDVLQRKGMLTFNEAFLHLAEDGGRPAPHVRIELLTPFTHLLVDEFQDISPQIAAWLKSCQRRLAAKIRPRQTVSLMAIGDDWQSIYGWRGSAPDFFIKFEKFFPSHVDIGEVSPITMMENFRSIAPIVKHAESMLSLVSNKVAKASVAKKPILSGGHGVRLYQHDDFEDASIKKISEFVLEEYRAVSAIKGLHKNKIILMSRTKGTLKALQKRIGKQPGIASYTYHGAKGLQAEVAVMVDDCTYDQTHIFRNNVYAATGLFSRGYDYDQAMRDEAFRLAYVGVTRGRSRVHWHVKASEGASDNSSASRALIDADGSIRQS